MEPVGVVLGAKKEGLRELLEPLFGIGRCRLKLPGTSVLVGADYLAECAGR
jgi:hypothetical protein